MTKNTNAALSLLWKAVETHPDKPAYIFDNDIISYIDVWRGASRFANLLHDKQVRPGERVMIVLPDTPAFVYAFLGTILHGAVAVAVNASLESADYAYILNDCEAACMLTTAEHVAANISVPPNTHQLYSDDYGPPEMRQAKDSYEACLGDPGRLGFMLYTSGSTGRPKGVPHRHADLLEPARTWGALLEISPHDVLFSTSKMSFAYGLLVTLVQTLAFGATAILYPDKPDPYAVFAAIATHRPNLFFSVPTFYNMMIRAFDKSVRCDSLRWCFSAGEALPPMLFEQWRQLTGLEILDGIGSTEAFNVFISNRPGKAKAGSSGQLVPGYEARLQDDAGQPVAPGAKGNLLVRGPTFAAFYWNQPEKTRETMLDDGFVRTGDVYVENDGFFTHQGRSDDMMKAGAHWISPVRIEETLLTHPVVAEAAVAGCRIEGLERPCAFVTLKTGTIASPALSGELRRYAKQRLPAEMCPVRFVFLTELPKTSTGKIQRFKLRQV